MSSRHGSFLIGIGILAGSFVTLLTAQTTGRHAGADVRTIDLVSQPEAQVLASAKKAFLQGDIVRIVGGKPQDLQRLLGIGGAILRPSKVLENSSHNPLPPQNIATLVYQIVAARATAAGALHEFQQLGTQAVNVNSSRDLSAYEKWAAKEGRLAQEEASESLPTEPKRPGQAWTELQQTTFQTTDRYSNVFQNTISVYRLNDIKPSNDWYMVLTDPASQPHYEGCKVFGTGDCGWWTAQRVFTMTTTPQFTLFDHGPTNTITTDTATFNIGGTIGATGPGVSSGYSETWQQPSVTTTDQSDLVHGVGKWNESFQGQGSFGSTPPETSIGLFVSHQGSIFRVPEGTSSFQFHLDEPVTSEFQPHFGEPYTNPFDYQVDIDIFPPVFAVSVDSISIAPGGSGSFEITAVNPSTSNNGLGLSWEITNVPQWLTVSQSSGSASTRLTFNVAPGTPLGSVGSINVNTNPASAAPSVEINPLLVRVTVGQPNETGIMFTGGNNSQGLESVADLYNPQLGKFDFEAPMESPRSNHTATLLMSGQLLLTGGSIGNNAVTASAELFDPGKAQFMATAGMMTDSREFHTATLLQNGQVLLAGGVDNSVFNGGENALAAAELYNPDTQFFTATGSMTMMRAFHSATALLDGTVLITGGVTSYLFQQPTNAAEIYDPATGHFTKPAGNMVSARFYHTATLLKDGHVLIVGGYTDGGAVSAAAELYNPATKTFSPVGNLNVERLGHTATLLTDGTVLIAGGEGPNGSYLASAELYNPETQMFTLLSNSANCPGNPGCMTAPRAFHTATRQPDGTVLLAFGSAGRDEFLGSTEIYNPRTKIFSAGASTTPRLGHTATLLQHPATTVSLISSLNPSSEGQKITLTATVTTTDGVAPTGSVTFEDGTSVLGTVDLQPSNKGVATLTVGSLSVGPHSLTANYSGDSTHAKSASSILVQTVKSQATTTTLRSSQNPSNPGQLVTFTATVAPASFGSPTGSVIFRNNGTQLSAVPLTGNTAIFRTSSLEPGSNPITATYSGDLSFAGSGSPVLTQNVTKAPTKTALSSTPNPSKIGQPVTFTAIVSASSGGPPTGAVTFLDGGSVLGTQPLSEGGAALRVPTLASGTHNITANYGGNSSFTGSVSPVLAQQVAGLVTPTVVLTAQPSTVTFGRSVTFRARVSYPGGPVATGSITISEATNGANIYGTAVLKNGVGVVRNSTIPVGSYNLVATYGGDGGIHYNGAQSSSVPLRVVVGGSQTKPIVAVSASIESRNNELISVRLIITNNGMVDAHSITLNGIALRTLVGRGEAQVVSPMPIAAGTLAPGASTVVSLQLQVPLTVKKLMLNENGAVRDQSGKVYEFNPGQVISLRRQNHK